MMDRGSSPVTVAAPRAGARHAWPADPDNPVRSCALGREDRPATAPGTPMSASTRAVSWPGRRLDHPGRHQRPERLVAGTSNPSRSSPRPGRPSVNDAVPTTFPPPATRDRAARPPLGLSPSSNRRPPACRACPVSDLIDARRHLGHRPQLWLSPAGQQPLTPRAAAAPARRRCAPADYAPPGGHATGLAHPTCTATAPDAVPPCARTAKPCQATQHPILGSLEPPRPPRPRRRSRRNEVSSRPNQWHDSGGALPEPHQTSEQQGNLEFIRARVQSWLHGANSTCTIGTPARVGAKWEICDVGLEACPPPAQQQRLFQRQGRDAIPSETFTWTQSLRKP